jgi:glyoxylase-like metal-dependent hydrolase (beta-lactamase superfamily II)
MTWPPGCSRISGSANRSASSREQIVKWIEATGKNLTTIYITHGHSDHFFGLNPILSVFPEAVFEQSQEASS